MTLWRGDAVKVLPTLERDSVDLIATDPPYGVGWRSNFRQASPQFDEIAGDDGALDVPAVLSLALTALRNGRHVYVFGYAPEVLAGPLNLSSTADLVWDKQIPGMGDLSVPWAPSHERITFGVSFRSRKNREDGKGRLTARLRHGSVLHGSRAHSGGVKRHPTEKPVALMRQLIESSSTLGEVVLDPFAGSGSTLVAAVLSGRRAIGIELDGDYSRVAIERVGAAEELADRIEEAS